MVNYYSLFTERELFQYSKMENILVANAKINGIMQPLLSFWNDKRELLLRRAFERAYER